MTVYFHTLGCKVNQYETQAMRVLMEAEGYATSEELFNGIPEVWASMQDVAIVINSCTVTEESDRKLRQLLRLPVLPDAVDVVLRPFRKSRRVSGKPISCWATRPDGSFLAICTIF